jgi:asparagine synthase (glutamine-hydrolysing)
MIKDITSNYSNVNLNSKFTNTVPTYIYWSEKKNILLYSDSIKELLDNNKVNKPLKIFSQSLSFLLQSGFIPPPRTIYEDIYILGIGDSVKIVNQNKKIKLKFEHHNPFLKVNETEKKNNSLNCEDFLQILATACLKQIDTSKPTFLFHSAGKDSNTIAASLALAGWQKKVTLVCHDHSGINHDHCGKIKNESTISYKIAKKLGFKHIKLKDYDKKIDTVKKKEIHNIFLKSPFPCLDKVMLAYPLYVSQISELKNSNIIDGSGNDFYFGTPPSYKEKRFLLLSRIFQNFTIFRKLFKSENILSSLGRTSAEWAGGCNGFTYLESRKFYKPSKNLYNFWLNETLSRRHFNLIDFKTSIYTPWTIAEMHIRKVQNFADSVNSKLILPFTDRNVVSYITNLSEENLIDINNLKNKIFLRQLLKKYIGLDSDKLGKYGWGFHPIDLLFNNLDFYSAEITNCKLWEQDQIKTILERLISKAIKADSSYSAANARTYILNLYLISAWINKNIYVN